MQSVRKFDNLKTDYKSNIFYLFVSLKYFIGTFGFVQYFKNHNTYYSLGLIASMKTYEIAAKRSADVMINKAELIEGRNNLNSSENVILFVNGLHATEPVVKKSLGNLLKLKFKKDSPSIFGINGFYGIRNSENALNVVKIATNFIGKIKDKNIILVGHSQGGVLATQIGNIIEKDFPEIKFSVIGIASPIYINGGFAKSALGKINKAIGYTGTGAEKVNNFYAKFDEVLILEDVFGEKLNLLKNEFGEYSKEFKDFFEENSLDSGHSNMWKNAKNIEKIKNRIEEKFL